MFCLRPVLGGGGVERGEAESRDGSSEEWRKVRDLCPSGGNNQMHIEAESTQGAEIGVQR